MELDKLKNTWSKASEVDTKPSDEQILNLLKTSNKSILSKTISMEAFALKSAFILTTIPLFVSALIYILFPHMVEAVIYIFSMIVMFLAALIVWTSIKLSYLKKIDIVNSGILSISKYINKYKSICIYESVISSICFILFLYILLTVIYDSTLFEYLLFGGLSFVLSALAFLYARHKYKGTIGAIERNLEEIRVFEREKVA